MSELVLTTDEEARALLKDMRWRAGTLFRALDRDGDGVLSAEEIAAAPQVLRSLASDDGCIRDKEMGGPTLVPGLVRRSGIVRLLDSDGDLVIGPSDIDQASARILRLDADGDGCVTADDDLPDLSANTENRMPMGTPAQMLAYQRKMFTREPDITGPLPPKSRAGVQPGYLLVQEVNDRSDVQKTERTFLMNEEGGISHAWHTENRLPEATVAYLLDNGNLLRTTCLNDWLIMDGQFPIGANGTISIEAKDGTVLWQWTHLEFGAEALHHDIEIMPNGNILAICWLFVSAAQAHRLGWKQQGERDHIVLDKVYEIQPNLETGETIIVWQWSVADHLLQDSGSQTKTSTSAEDVYRKIDVNWPQLDDIQFNANQLLHMNSVSYNAEEDIILLSSAIFGEIWVIDHSTTPEQASGSEGGRYGRGGDLIWRWGNPQTYGVGGPAEQVLFWQHDAHFLHKALPRQGEIMVFNNGMRRNAQGQADYEQICMGLITGAYSNVLEIKLPRDKEGFIASGEPAEIVWQYNSDGAVDFYSPFMSNASRLPNGNTLMVQACDKRVAEINACGETVMDFHLGGPGRLYRVYKYAPEHPGIKALGL